jgi:hypothetical protein
MGGWVSGVGAGVGDDQSPTAPLFFRIMVVVVIVQSGVVCVIVCIDAVIDL